MTLKSDAQGFLVGELIDANKDILSWQEAGTVVMKDIRRDVRAIARTLGVQGRSTPTQTTASRATATQTTAPRATPPAQSSSRSGRYPPPAGGTVRTPAGRAPGIGVATGRGSAADVRRQIDQSGATSDNALGSAVMGEKARQQRAVAAIVRRSSGVAVVPGGRDARGRFTGSASGGGSGGAGEIGGSFGGVTDRLSGAVDRLSGALSGSENIDPTLQAAGEIKAALTPIGRGFGVLFGRGQERRKERWYSKILKAITGRKNNNDSPKVAVMGDSDSGSDTGLMAAAGAMLARFALPIIGAVVAGVVAIAAAGVGWLVGTYIGDQIYKWLDKSGIATKIFDAFDAIGKWFNDKVKAPIKTATENFKTGYQDASEIRNMAPAVLDASGRNINDPRRTDAMQATFQDGRAINDPRRLDLAEPDLAPLAPSRSFAESLGRGVGTIKRVLRTEAGFNEIERSDGSTVRQTGARNWRNNNPGNIRYSNFAVQQGAIGYDTGKDNTDRFAIFPDMATGRRAQEALLFKGKEYKNKILTDAISRYAPPSENDTGAYQSSVLGAVGGQNKKMSEYSPSERSAILNQMAKREGFKVGTVVPISPSFSLQAIPSSVPANIQNVPDIKMPSPVIANDGKPISVTVKTPIGQDVGDRGIAHHVGGGIGQPY